MKRALFALNIVLSGAITLYGVLHLGWSAPPLVVLFVLEGLIVLLTDYIRHPFLGEKERKRDILVIETAFILFYGMFAVLVFGPYDSLESLISDGAMRLVDIVCVFRPMMTGCFGAWLPAVSDHGYQ